MPEPLRIAGKLGCLPPLQGADRLPLKWAHEYLAAPLPTPVYPIDVSQGRTSWPNLGNDIYGDCGPQATYYIRTVTAMNDPGVPVPVFDRQTVINEYLAYDGGQDRGVVLAYWLQHIWNAYQVDKTTPDGILAFAPIDHTNRAQCDAFIQAGHSILIGVSLTDDDDWNFSNRVPWGKTAPGQPYPTRYVTPDGNLGHAVAVVGSDGVDTGKCLTWTEVQSFTYEWWNACVTEAWLLVTTEEQLAAFTPALLDDVASLGGKGGVPMTWPAGYDASAAPTAWVAGQPQTFNVTVTNTGTTTWNAAGTDPVHLGAHFASKGGGYPASYTPIWYIDQRIALPADVAPGASVTLPVTLTAPPSPTGPMVLEFQMVKESEFWFSTWADVNVTVATGPPPPPPPPPTPSSFYAITPVRVLDTRNATGAPAGPVAGGQTINLTIGGVAGVPTTGVKAVVLNVTVTQPTGPGYLTVFPAGRPLPNSSNLNWSAAETVPNLVIVGVGANGQVSLFVAPSCPAVHLIADVVGWFA